MSRKRRRRLSSPQAVNRRHVKTVPPTVTSVRARNQKQRPRLAKSKPLPPPRRKDGHRRRDRNHRQMRRQPCRHDRAIDARRRRHDTESGRSPAEVTMMNLKMTMRTTKKKTKRKWISARRFVALLTDGNHTSDYFRTGECTRGRTRSQPSASNEIESIESCQREESTRRTCIHGSHNIRINAASNTTSRLRTALIAQRSCRQSHLRLVNHPVGYST